MVSRFLILLLLASPLWVPTGARAQAGKGKKVEVVTRAVGQVGDHVITTREVILSGVIERWLYAIQDRPSEILRQREKLSWFLTPDTEEFRTQLSRVMLDLMVSREAESLSVAEISAHDVEVKTTRFVLDFASFPAWRRLGPSTAEVQDLMQRKLRARAFLQFKTETSGVLVSDEEAQAYFEKNRMKFGNYPFQQFRQSIKEVIAQQHLESRLKDWFEVLKKKHKVRFLNPPPSSS